MRVEDILLSMRSGEIQSKEAIEAFIEGVTHGGVSRPQAAAWLAWAFARTLTTQETVHLAAAMTRSGKVMDWGPGPLLIDKHSTGGVGDKVSLVLAPLWAALGHRVPMVSGRGLGHTGGTLDKLESIPGFQVDLPEARLREILDDVGCFMAGQTDDIAPADRTLYALRNEIQAVESIPLIVGSILSKKFAEGVHKLVLDVKAGSGAFMKSPEQARQLARALVEVATGYGVDCRAFITEMNRPLGLAIGNAVEVRESIDCLKGGGPADLRACVLALADHPDAARALDDGSAYACFERLVAAHGGDLASLTDTSRLRGAGVTEHVVHASRGGWVSGLDAYDLGVAVFRLGAGRRIADDPVDHGVGIELMAQVGDRVLPDQPLMRVWHRDGHALDDALQLIERATSVSDAPVEAGPLVIDVVEPVI